MQASVYMWMKINVVQITLHSHCFYYNNSYTKSPGQIPCNIICTQQTTEDTINTEVSFILTIV